MPFSLSRTTATATLLVSFIVHSLSAPLTTWTPVHVKVDADPQKGTFFDVPLAGTYVNPSVIVSDIVISSPTPSHTATFGNTHFLPSNANSPYSPTPGMLNSLSQYHSFASVSKNVIMIFQLIFGAALCLILGLGSLLSRLHQRYQGWSRHSHHRRSISIEMEVGDDMQIVVVKMRSMSSRYPASPSKSALCSPERKASLGKSVRWADEVAMASDLDLGCGMDRMSQELLHQANLNDAARAY